jgi:DMSO/TMAO reductase YedYZ molybdopterin-dependent catalytic subunit
MDFTQRGGKKMRAKVLALVAVLMVVSLGACGSAAPKAEWTLEVNGAVANPLTLSYADLADMEQVDLEDILMEKSTGEDTVGSWGGVSLDKILADAGAPADFASITAIAADGYAIEVPRDELPDAIVALKEEGEWIATADPEHGPIRLVTPFTPANRWVFQIQTIQVNETSAGAAGIPDNAALKITGNVENEIGWSEEKVRAMDTIEAQSTNKAGETSTYTGVLINDLLAAAGPNADATTVVFVADDGYTAEAPLADVQACADCIVSFRNQGGFSTVLPGFSGGAQVKGVIEIQVK